ncbi:SHOCT domain containing protein [Burkholderiaceae bacterium]|jgi:hypothetical protein
MNKIIAVLLAVSIITTGCASTPANPIPIAQVGDETKPCDAIINEMQQMITAQDKAAADREKQIGTNVALGITGAILIVPWFFMDLGATATVEQKAAAARYQRLQQMAVDKKCTGVPVMKTEQVAAGNSDGKSTDTSPSVASGPSVEVQRTPQNVSAQSSAAPVSANSSKDSLPNPAKRLEELNDLFKKGLITQKDYDTKKAEILKSL